MTRPAFFASRSEKVATDIDVIDQAKATKEVIFGHGSQSEQALARSISRMNRVGVPLARSKQLIRNHFVAPLSSNGHKLGQLCAEPLRIKLG
jgi:hypothetical protein